MSATVGLNMCDWRSCSSPLGLHVPSPFGQCALVRKGGAKGLAPRAGRLGNPLAPAGKQASLGGRRPPNSIPRQSQNLNFCQVNFVAGSMKHKSTHLSQITRKHTCYGGFQLQTRHPLATPATIISPPPPSTTDRRVVGLL